MKIRRRLYKGAGRQRAYDCFFDEWLRTGKIETGGSVSRSAAFRAFEGLEPKASIGGGDSLQAAAQAAGRDARRWRLRAHAIARNLNRADRHTLQILLADLLAFADLKGELTRRGFVGDGGLLTELGRVVARASLELERAGELEA